MTKDYLPLRKNGDDKRPLQFLTPYPQKLKLGQGGVDLGGLELKIVSSSSEDVIFLEKELGLLGLKTSNGKSGYPIELSTRDLKLAGGSEAYVLKIDAGKAEIIGQGAAGLRYGIQTFLQIVGFLRGYAPALKISDWPHYKVRSVMIDMGRSVYPVPLIKRVVRIMARLKLNMLHMHLYDDQLMGLRFDKMPLGSENPFAIPVAKLAEIVDYAKGYNVSICPEMESWGHVGSVVHHYPECYGAPGMWEGSSFGIGQETLGLLGRVYDEVIPCLADGAMVHLGLDEAKWQTLPSVKDPSSWTPERLVGELYDLLMATAKRHGKSVEMRIWADHGGRPIPSQIADKVIVEPWGYFERMRADIKVKVAKYSGEGKSPFIMGGGASSTHFSGTFGATRIWCREAMKSPNCQGINMCLWEGNFFDAFLPTLFGGATPAWNPAKAEMPSAKDSYREVLTGFIMARLLSFQSLFEDADAVAIAKDRGPRIYRGYYMDGIDAGQSVAPTVDKVTSRSDDGLL